MRWEMKTTNYYLEWRDGVPSEVDTEERDALLAEGWEPFATSVEKVANDEEEVSEDAPTVECVTVFLRRQRPLP